MIDIIRISASRPDLLTKSTESMIKNIKYSGELRYHLHEDVLNSRLSDECLKYANESKVFTTIYSDNPPIGQGPSLSMMLDNVASEYVIHWEDDYELIQPLDLDMVVKILDENKDVNQICFHKRRIMKEKPGYVKIQVERSGVELTTNPHWAFMPAIWRMSYIMPKWKSFPMNIHWEMNHILKGGKNIENIDCNWVIKNTGTYYLGAIGHGHYTNHIGFERSLREGEEQKKW